VWLQITAVHCYPDEIHSHRIQKSIPQQLMQLLAKQFRVESLHNVGAYSHSPSRRPQSNRSQALVWCVNYLGICSLIRAAATHSLPLAPIGRHHPTVGVLYLLCSARAPAHVQTSDVAVEWGREQWAGWLMRCLFINDGTDKACGMLNTPAVIYLNSCMARVPAQLWFISQTTALNCGGFAVI